MDTKQQCCTHTLVVMASASSAYTIHTSKTKLDHIINFKVYDALSPNTYSRTVSAGKSILGLFKPNAYSTQPLENRELPVQKVNSFEEYISGCIEHERCMGHFCVTAGGNILLPQRFSVVMGQMSNDYAKAAEAVFKNDTPTQGLVYRNTIKDLQLGKQGKMRGGIMGGATDCSAREVIASSWVEPNTIAIPRMVAKNMHVLRIMKDETTGLPIGHYIEDEVREGDWVIAIRPPSLWAGNDQPMKVVLWEHECFGPSASNLDEFHGDNDGDEMQIYLIVEEHSIKECEKWKQLNPCKFLEAVKSNKLPSSMTKFVYSKDKITRELTEPFGNETYDELRKVFMVTSTLSVKELVDGVKLPNTAGAARMKELMTNMFVDRLKNPTTTASQFSQESVRGIRDIMAQQLHQGRIGDMSRQARLAATCVKYKGHGLFHIMSGNEVVKVLCPPLQDISIDDAYPLGGNSCVRAVSAICAVAQQAALDSHRVSQEVSSKLDLINNFMKGGEESLIYIESGELPVHSWKYKTAKGIYCVVNNDLAVSSARKIIAAYNPIILRAIKSIGGDIRTVCKNGVVIVCNYYNIKLSTLELYSVTELLCYRCEASSDPITTKSGLEARNMRWMVTMFANHYTKLIPLQNKGITRKLVRPQTITEAVSLCNFDYL